MRPIGDILRQMVVEVAPSTACRSGDGSVERVREWLATPRRLKALTGMTPFAAVDRLLFVAGFNDKARNQRLRWARLLAQRLGMDAGPVVAAILADVVQDGTAVSVGGCLGYRLKLIVQGEPERGLSGAAPGDLLDLLRAAFPKTSP